MLSYFKLNELEFSSLLKCCMDGYGEVNSNYLRRGLDVVENIIEKYSRICAIRIDLRFAKESLESDIDSLICMQRSDPAVITRFFESLKSQLRHNHKRKGYHGEPVLPAYIWCRERDTGLHAHYHVVLLFNKDRYAFLGSYQDPDDINMATRIQQAWCSALNLAYPNYSNLVHFPKSHTYWFDIQSANLRSATYTDFLFRMSYLCKEETKELHSGQRNFGTSQLKL